MLWFLLRNNMLLWKFKIIFVDTMENLWYMKN